MVSKPPYALYFKFLLVIFLRIQIYIFKKQKAKDSFITSTLLFPIFIQTFFKKLCSKMFRNNASFLTMFSVTAVGTYSRMKIQNEIYSSCLKEHHWILPSYFTLNALRYYMSEVLFCTVKQIVTPFYLTKKWQNCHIIIVENLDEMMIFSKDLTK